MSLTDLLIGAGQGLAESAEQVADFQLEQQAQRKREQRLNAEWERRFGIQERSTIAGERRAEQRAIEGEKRAQGYWEDRADIGQENALARLKKGYEYDKQLLTDRAEVAEKYRQPDVQTMKDGTAYVVERDGVYGYDKDGEKKPLSQIPEENRLKLDTDDLSEAEEKIQRSLVAWTEEHSTLAKTDPGYIPPPPEDAAAAADGLVKSVMFRDEMGIERVYETRNERTQQWIRKWNPKTKSYDINWDRAWYRELGIGPDGPQPDTPPEKPKGKSWFQMGKEWVKKQFSGDSSEPPPTSGAAARTGRRGTAESLRRQPNPLPEQESPDVAPRASNYRPAPPPDSPAATGATPRVSAPSGGAPRTTTQGSPTPETGAQYEPRRVRDSEDNVYVQLAPNTPPIPLEEYERQSRVEPSRAVEPPAVQEAPQLRSERTGVLQDLRQGGSVDDDLVQSQQEAARNYTTPGASVIGEDSDPTSRAVRLFRQAVSQDVPPSPAVIRAALRSGLLSATERRYAEALLNRG